MARITDIVKATDITLTTAETEIIPWTHTGVAGRVRVWARNGTAQAIQTLTVYGAPDAAGVGSLVLDNSTIAAVAIGTAATVTSSNAENYAIVANVSDKVSISISGAEEIVIQLTAGAARTAAQVAAEIAAIAGVTSADAAGSVSVTTDAVGATATFEFIATPNDAYTVLGFATGVIYLGVENAEQLEITAPTPFIRITGDTAAATTTATVWVTRRMHA